MTMILKCCTRVNLKLSMNSRQSKKTEESSPNDEPSSKLGKKLKPQKSPQNEGVDLDKEEETQPAFANLKLKKASRVPREWDEPELESVQLVNQKFEPLPHSEDNELDTKA